MKTQTNDKIRQSVRNSYAKIARGQNASLETLKPASCCGISEELSPTQNTVGCGCGGSEPSFKDFSKFMGYSENDMASVPDGANLGLGCGNPLALASLKSGETLVDLGSGGGFDCFLAAKKVGETGKVIGVDMTPDMISKANENVLKTEFKNVEFRLGEIEHLPVADAVADIIISNCVINLSPDKLSVYKEAFRVLKPGGRLSVSDIVATAKLPDEIRQNLTMVSACVGGAATIDQTRAMLKQADFEDICVTPKDESRTIIDEWVPGKSAGEYVVSAYIEAVKPE
ncbi:MAG: arsenite methyltransferase [Deltaproteobacteria bacterium]|nr:arsenite methyltransferase [Deltaproteobacteria bacterium]